MLSTPKESPEARATLESEGSSPFSSFLKVADSIQGLDRLLEDISLEKILDADKKAKQLIEHLAVVQKDLTLLKEIKQSLSKTEQSGVNNANETPPDAVPETANNPSFSRPNPLPKNLIHFPGSLRVSKLKKEPSPLQSASSCTTPLKAEEKQDQKRNSDEGAPFYFGKSLDIKTSTPSYYIPSSPKNTEKEPDPSDIRTQSLKTNTSFDEQVFHGPHKDCSKLGSASAKPRIPSSPGPVSPNHSHSAQVNANSVRLRKIAEPPPYEIIQSRFKSEGDLDRKLKSIIRDYGEVDIYSYRNNDGMRKKALIVTLVLLLGYLASSFFFPLHQNATSATALRLQPAVTTEHVKVPEPRKSIDDSAGLDRDVPAAFSAEPTPTNEPERYNSDL